MYGNLIHATDFDTEESGFMGIRGKYINAEHRMKIIGEIDEKKKLHGRGIKIDKYGYIWI
jgi:hypothetical protein